MKKKILVLFLILMSIIPFVANADRYDADRHQMKLILTDIQNKLNKRQFDPLMPYFDKNAVITFYSVVTGVKIIEGFWKIPCMAATNERKWEKQTYFIFYVTQ